MALSTTAINVDVIADTGRGDPLRTGGQTINTNFDAVGTAVQTIQYNAQTGTSYIPVLADRLKIITMNNASANTVTLPQNSDVDFPIGSYFFVRQLGAGTTSIAAGTGASIEKPASMSLAIREQFATAICEKVDTNKWHVEANITGS